MALPDRIRPPVRVLFVGINPGARSAAVGHHFAGHSNRFWTLLFESGLIPEAIRAEDDSRLTEWGYGLTNLIPRMTPGIDTLRSEEYVAGARVLRRKVRRYRPAIVAFLGVTLFRSVFDLKAGAIWAVGDVVEVVDVVTGQEVVLPLAGPANRQGRVAAESIAGRATNFRGIQATAVVGVFGLTVASTGASEKGLRRAGVMGFEKVYLHPGHHASYYPGASPIHLKLLFSVPDGRVLGAQAVGLEGVEKRIDVIATTIQFHGTVHDLAEAELCYAPQFGAAKDPINVAGMLAQNVLNGDMPVADWAALGREGVLLLDVREPDEFAGGHLPDAVNLPLSQMRRRYTELPRDRDIWVYCGVGQRAYFASRFLAQHGFQSRNLSGGYATYQALTAAGLMP